MKAWLAMRAFLPRAALSLALLVAMGAAAAEEQAPAAIDQLVTRVMREQQIPAITIAMASGDRLVYSKAFGAADLENAVAATPETAIRTGSIAKSITAVAAMTLVEAGKLDLDVPVQRYCAPFPPKQWPITTRELLGHTAGIRHYKPGEMDDTHHFRWMADGFALFADDPLLFPPGTGYSYSTYGFTVAGCAIEGASGVRFQDYVADHVLKPAGMTHTLVDDVFEIVPHRARGYQKIDGRVKNANLMDSSYKIPGGGYVSTAEDLVRFAQALLGGKLLRPGTLAEMWTPSKVSGDSHYALGFTVQEGGKFVSHTGGQPGTSTRLLIIPQAHFAVAMLANMDSLDLGELEREVVTQMHLPYPAPAKP